MLEQLDLATVAASTIVGIVTGLAFYFLGRTHKDEELRHEIWRLQEEINDLTGELDDIHTGERASKFRVRTVASTGEKKAIVKKARLRAFKSATPPPRK